jgi:hypothetical protein
VNKIVQGIYNPWSVWSTRTDNPKHGGKMATLTISTVSVENPEEGATRSTEFADFYEASGELAVNLLTWTFEGLMTLEYVHKVLNKWRAYDGSEAFSFTVNHDFGADIKTLDTYAFSL